jgi:hypothetical protein
MVGSDIRLGPWTDGINLLDKPDQLRDTQLISCVNFDVDNTGVLEPRRALRFHSQDAGASLKYLMATITLANEVQPRALVSVVNAGVSSFKAIGSPDNQTEFTVTRAGTFRSAVQYQNKIWYIPADASSVGAQSPASATNTMTSVASMPYGDYGFILKDRLFIIRKATSAIYFSAATAFEPSTDIPTPWAEPDGGVVFVNPGDNNPITKVVVVNNQIVIFKRDSTYVLSFTASPLGDGVLRQVSPDQGAIDAITYNNEVYCYNSRSVFKFVNGYFQDIGLQLALPNLDTIDSSVTNPARINVVGKTLVFGTTPSGKTYAMNLDTGAWTTYTFSGDNTVSSGTIFSRSSVGTAIFFGDGTSVISYMLVTRGASTDRNSAGVYLAPEYLFRTKEYNFDDSEAWKRMYSWHLDSSFSAAVTGNARTYINGVQNNTTSDVMDLVGSSLSYRFRTTSMGYVSIGYTSLVGAFVGPVIRGIRAVIGAKAPVSL